MVLAFAAIAIIIGILCQKHAGSVDRLRSGRAQRRPLAVRVRIRHQSYFSAVVFVGYAGQFGWKYGMAATVGRHRQRHFGQPSGLVGARPAHARDDAPPGRHHHAGILRQALSQSKGAAHRRGGHHLRVPHSLHRERLQRPVASVRHGVRPALRGVRHRHGGYHLHLRGASAATWPP